MNVHNHTIKGGMNQAYAFTEWIACNVKVQSMSLISQNPAMSFYNLKTLFQEMDHDEENSTICRASLRDRQCSKYSGLAGSQGTSHRQTLFRSVFIGCQRWHCVWVFHL